MSINPLHNNNFIDSCAFDPKYEPEDAASVEIFTLHQVIGLPLHIAHSTQKEIEHPNTPTWVKREANKLIYTISVQLTSLEVRKLEDIRRILAGTGKIENVQQDAQHIFEAQKYGSYFVTTDSRILSRADMLKISCDVVVLKPSEFLAIVKQYKNKQKNDSIVSIQTETRLNENREANEESTINTYLYKGYRIDAVPYKLADSGEWTIDINISRDTGNEVNIRHFSAGNRFKAEKEAINHCLNFGKKIIDGEYDHCTVLDL